MSEHLINRGAPAGYVWFVGAGPGARDLITLRGAEALRRAEVVIHDELAGAEVLEFCPASCERIFVGKRAGRHSVTQPEIDWLLVSHARAGARVVRLKGGDPSVFGRLAEELLALRVAQIPFEIVPGVTAACAAAAAAEVPLTSRPGTSAAIFVTGHECAGKSQPFDWAKVARTDATLCIYMGTRRLAEIARRLIEAGRPASTPLLLISNASLPHQVIQSATLEEADLLQRENQSPPAVILIGEVAASNRQLLAVHHREPEYAAHG